MAFTKKIFSIFLAVLLLSFISCKKYPENDRIYLSSVKSRLLSKNWHINTIMIDDGDSTSKVIQKFYAGSTNDVYLVFFYKNSDDIIYTLNYPNVPWNNFSNVSLIEKKTKIRSNWYWTTNNWSISDFEIKKLTKTELILYSEWETKKYRISFTKE